MNSTCVQFAKGNQRRLVNGPVQIQIGGGFGQLAGHSVGFARFSPKESSPAATPLIESEDFSPEDAEVIFHLESVDTENNSATYTLRPITPPQTEDQLALEGLLNELGPPIEEPLPCLLALDQK